MTLSTLTLSALALSPASDYGELLCEVWREGQHTWHVEQLIEPGSTGTELARLRGGRRREVAPPEVSGAVGGFRRV